MSGSPPSLFLPYLGLFPSQSQVSPDCGIPRVLLVVWNWGGMGTFGLFYVWGTGGRTSAVVAAPRRKQFLLRQGRIHSFPKSPLQPEGFPLLCSLPTYLEGT